MSSCINLRKFECPVCYDVIVPPVYHCKNGHLICQCCLKQCVTCPTCREPMSNTETGGIRCLELEKIIREQVYSCPHDGCQEESLKADDYMEHKKNCVYRKAQFCSLLRVRGGCNVEMALNKLAQRLTECHPGTTKQGFVYSGDVITFNSDFNQAYRGTFVFFCWVTGRNNASKEFPVALVETWKEDFVYWSPIILASPTFAGRFLCDISIGPDSAAADAQMIKIKRVMAHCPESGTWNESNDFCTSMSYLGKLVGVGTPDREWYEVKVRLYDKNEGRYYQFRCSEGAK